MSKALSYFIKKGFYEYSRGWYKGTCVYCGSEDKAGVNPYRNFYHCFKCEEKGNMLSVIKEVESLKTMYDTRSFLNNLEEVHVPPPAKGVRPEIPDQILPNGFISIRRGKGVLGDKARDYVTKVRNIPLKVAIESGTGYGSDSESRYFGYIIFPYIEFSGKVKTFQARRFLSVEPKILNPTVDEVGLGKSLTLYNEKALYKFKEVSVVESPLNAMTLWPNAVAGSGKAFSKWQKSLIYKSPVKTLNLILDPDAYSYSVELARYFITNKQVRIIRLPEGMDVNDVGTEETKKYIDNTKVIESKLQLERFLYESGYRDRRVKIFT